MKIEMYGAPICGDCVAAKAVLMTRKEIELIYYNITESTAELKSFLKYRDQEAIFDEIKKDGKIGIPFFILEDGTMTFDIKQHIDIEWNEEDRPMNACSLDGKGSC